VRITPPLVPVIVRLYVPGGVEGLGIRFRLLVALPPVIVFGVKVAVTPDGSPLAERPTSPLNEPTGVIVIVLFAPPFGFLRLTVTELGEAEREKSGCATTSVTVVVWTFVPPVPVIVSV